MSTINQNNLISVGAQLPEGHLAVRIGELVFPVGISVPTGIDTNDATATASQMLSGATAYVKGHKVTGNIDTISIVSDGSTVTVPKGYNPVEQTFEVGSSGGDISLPEVTVSADKLLSGVTAIKSDGSVVTGTIATVSLSRNGNTVSIDKGYTEGGSITVPASGSTETASYYACASADSESWLGYAGNLTDNVLSFPGDPVTLPYSGNAPTSGNMYLADATMKVVPNGKYIPIKFVSLAGGATSKPFAIELEADTRDIYNEVYYTLDAPGDFEYSDGIISGTMPSSAEPFTMTLLAETDGYISVAARIDVTPVTISSNAPFIHFPFSNSLDATTGQHLVPYGSSYEMPKLVTVQNRQCIQLGAEYDDYYEGYNYAAAKTFEYTGLTGSATMTVAFFARLEPPEQSDDGYYYSTPDCVCFGRNKSTGRLLRFSPLVRGETNEDEGIIEDSNLIASCDFWNFYAEADTGKANDYKFHHYAFVLSGKSMSIYFDGTLLKTQTISGTVALDNSPMFIGRGASNGYEQFYGHVSDVKVWDRALSVAEISALQ